MESSYFSTYSGNQPLVVKQRPMSVAQRLNATSTKVAIFVVLGGLIGGALIGMGTYDLFMTEGFIISSAIAGGGVLLWGVDLVGIAIALVVKHRRQNKRNRAWIDNKGHFVEFKPTNIGHLNSKYNDPEGDTSFSRDIIVFSTQGVKRGFVRKNTPAKPQFYVKAGGDLSSKDHGLIQDHTDMHPLNDAIAYSLANALGLDVVPETVAFDNPDAAEKVLSNNVFAEVEFNRNGEEWVVIVQKAVPNGIEAPNSNTQDVNKWLKDTKLDKEHAHKALLFNLIAGRIDNHYGKIKNSVVSKRDKKQPGKVYEVDCDQLGAPLKEQVANLGKMHMMGNNGLIYPWLFDHEVAEMAFSEELIGQILTINPNNIRELFMAIEEHYKIKLDPDFKANILQNLVQVQRALRDGSVSTPLDLFKELYPDRVKKVNGQQLSYPEIHHARVKPKPKKRTRRRKRKK